MKQHAKCRTILGWVQTGTVIKLSHQDDVIVNCCVVTKELSHRRLLRWCSASQIQHFTSAYCRRVSCCSVSSAAGSASTDQSRISVQILFACLTLLHAEIVNVLMHYNYAVLLEFMSGTLRRAARGSRLYNQSSAIKWFLTAFETLNLLTYLHFWSMIEKIITRNAWQSLAYSPLGA